MLTCIENTGYFECALLHECTTLNYCGTTLKFGTCIFKLAKY